MRRAIIQRRSIKRPNLSFVAFAFLPLIETGLRLIAKQAALDHLRNEFRHDEHFALGIVRQILMQVLHHVRENIQANQIERAEGCGFGATGRGASDLVNLFDRIAVFEHRTHRHERAEGADTICNEVRTILRDHDAFAQTFVEKTKHRT